MAELTGKTVAELPLTESPADTDIFPLSSSGTSKRITWATIKSLIRTYVLGGKVIPVIGYVDDASARSTISISADGNKYARIDPPTLPANAVLIAVSAMIWTNATGAFWISPYGEGGRTSYLFANGGTTITGLRCRFWYVINQ